MLNLSFLRRQESKPWRRAKYVDLLKEYSGCAIDDIGAVREKARHLGLDEVDIDDVVVINEIFEAAVEDALVTSIEQIY